MEDLVWRGGKAAAIGSSLSADEAVAGVFGVDA